MRRAQANHCLSCIGQKANKLKLSQHSSEPQFVMKQASWRETGHPLGVGAIAAPPEGLEIFVSSVIPAEVPQGSRYYTVR